MVKKEITVPQFVFCTLTTEISKSDSSKCLKAVDEEDMMFCQRCSLQLRLVTVKSH